MPDQPITPNNQFEDLLNASDFGKFGKGMDALASTQNIAKTNSELSLDQLEQSLRSQADAVNKQAKQNPLNPTYAQSIQLDNSGKFNRQLVGEDTEDYYARMQSFWDKAANGIGKGLGLATTTFLQGTAGLVYGLGQVVTGHGLNSLYNNDLSQAIEKFNDTTIENLLPNYYTARERSAEWYEPANLFSANFVFDKFIKNAGFSLGALAAGGLVGRAIKGVTSLIPLMQDADKAARFAQVLDESLQASTAENRLGTFNNLIRKAGQAYNAGVMGINSPVAQRFLVSTLGAATEGGIEAIQGLNEFRDNQIKAYYDKYGTAPSGAELSKINDLAESLGNQRFGLNMALLTATNYIMLPKILGSKYSTAKGIANTEAAGLAETSKIRVGEGFDRSLRSTIPTTTGKKFAYGLRNFADLFFSPTEAFEEASQYAIQRGVDNYYNKAYRGQGTDWMKDVLEFGYGRYLDVHDKEAWESLLLGGFSGGIQEGYHIVKNRGFFGTGGKRAKATNAFLGRANAAPLQGAMKSDAWMVEMANAAKRGVNLMHEGEGYIRQGDVLEAKDNEMDQLHNYLAARIKYGRYDLVKDDIDFLKQHSTSEAGLQELKDNGFADPNDTVQSYQQRLKNFETHAANINSLFNNFNLNYGGLTHTVDGVKQRLYPEEVIDKMVYAASKIADYDNRIPELSRELVQHGIPIEDAFNSIVERGSVKKEDTQAVLDGINSLKMDGSGKTITSDDRDRLKGSFRDLVELGLRRGSYIDQFEKIRKDPESFESNPTFARDGILSVPQNEAKGTRFEDVELGRTYPLREPLIRSGNSIILAPKVTPLNQTLAGEIETQLPNGQKSFIPVDNFRNFNLSPIANENEKVNEAFLKAFNKSLGKQKFENLPKIDNPTIEDAQKYLTEQDNNALTTDVMAELEPAMQDIEKRIKAEQAAAEKLRKNKDLKDKLDKTQQENDKVSSDVVPPDDISTTELDSKDEYPKATLPTFRSKEADFYDRNNPKDHQKRRLNFLTFLARIFGGEKAARIKVATITKNNEAFYGLKGLRDFVVSNIENRADLFENGQLKPDQEPIIKLYVVDDGGKLFLTDVNGNKKSELKGNILQEAINDGVFGVFHSDISGRYKEGSAKDDVNYSGGFTDEDVQQMNAEHQAWRERVLSQTDTTSTYEIAGISRGIVQRDNENKPVTSTALVTEADLLKDGILTVPTIRKQISVNGISYDFDLGQPMLTNGSNVDFLNNRKFTPKEAEGIYQLFHKFTQVQGDEFSRINNYLRSILYMTSKLGKGANAIYISDGDIIFGTQLAVPFTAESVEAAKDNIVEFLSNYYVKTNSKTASLQNQRFEEPYVEGNDLKFNSHGSYAEFMLSSQKGREPFLQTKAQRNTDSPTITSRYTTLKSNEFAFQPKSAPTNEQLVKEVEGEEPKRDRPLAGAFKKATESNDIEQEQKIEEKPKSGSIKEKFQNYKKKEGPTGDERDALGEFKLADEVYKPINLAKELAYIKEKTPFAVSLVNDLLKTPAGVHAWGSYKDMTINLFKYAQAGTGYHEAFEGIWKVFTSLQTKQNIQNEFRNRKGTFSFFDGIVHMAIPYSEATEQQMKETLADEFADYVQTGVLPTFKSKDNFIVKWFKDLLGFIKSIFNGSINSIDNLFKSIDSGKYKTAPYNSESFVGQEEYSLTGLNYLQKYETIRGVALQVFSEMLNPDGGLNISLTEFEESGEDELEGTIKKIYDKVLQRLERIYNEWMPQYPENFPPNLLHAYQSYWENVKQSWNEFKDMTNEYLRTFAIVESALDEDVERTRRDDYSNRDYVDDRKYFENDAKNTASRSIKLLFATLAEQEANSTAPDGIASKRSSATFMQQQINYSRNFNSLLYQIANVNSYSEKIYRLRQLGNTNPNFKALLRRLEANSKSQDGKDLLNYWKLQVRWWNGFSKQMPTSYIQFNQANGTSRTNTRDLGNATRVTAQSWIDGLKARAIGSTSGLTMQMENGDLVLNARDLPTRMQYPQDKIAFLNALGIGFNIDMYNKLNVQQQNKWSKAIVRLSQNLGNSRLIPLDDIRTTTGAAGSMEDIAEAFIQAGNDYESMYFDINNNRRARAIAPNYVSKLVNDINNSADIQSLYLTHPELRQVVDSIYLNEIFFRDGERVSDARMDIGYIQGSVDSLGKPIEGENLSIRDRMIQEINQNLNDRYYILVPADGKTQWLLTLRNLFSFQDISTNANNWNQTLENRMLNYYITERNDYEGLVKRIGDTNAAKRAGIFKEISNNYKMSDAEFRQAINDFIQEKVGWQRRQLEESGVVRRMAKQSPNFAWYNIDADFLTQNKLVQNRLKDKDINDILSYRTVNWMVNNIETHKMFFGSPLEYKDSKRYKLFLSPRESTFHGSEEFNNYMNERYNQVDGIALSNPLLGQTRWSDEYKTVTTRDVRISNEELGKIDKKYNQAKEEDATNATDASAISTIVAMRQRRMRAGNWQSKDDEQFEYAMARDRQLMLKDGVLINSTYPKELQDHDKALLKEQNPFFKKLLGRKSPSYFYVEKPIVSGHTTIDGGEYFPVTDKFSIVSYSYAAIRNTNFRDHYVKMLNQDIGYVIMQSGRKVGARGADNFYNEDGSVNTNPYENIINIPFSAYGVQTDTSSKKESQTRGTQVTKLAIVNLYDKGVAKPEAANLVQHNLQLLKELTAIGYNKLLKELGAEDTGDGYKIGDKQKLISLIKEELGRREMPNSIKEQLQAVGNKLKTPFEALPNYQQIKNILYSHVDRNITSPKVSGSPKVQVSGALMESYGFRRTGNENVWTSAGLKFYTKEEPWMEIMLPFWASAKLRKAGIKWNTPEELHDVIKNSPDAQRIFSGVGFRIPTQEVNSIESFRIKGFLPEEMGDTVIVPEEITTKAGSDFDVDKLNTYIQNLYVDADKQVRIVPYFGIGEAAKDELKKWVRKDMLKDFWNNLSKDDEDALDNINYTASEERAESDLEKLYHQSIENEYFKNIQDILALPENFERLVTPNTADDLKDIRDQLVELAPYEFREGATKSIIDPEYMLKTRHNGQSVKKLVGIAALAQTRSAVAQLSVVTANFSRLIDRESSIIGKNKAILLPHNSVDGRPTISAVKDVEGRYITDKNSQYINGAVDVFNDAFLAQLNFNRKTAGLYLMLEDIGVPNSTKHPIVSLFMNQPIVRRFLKESDVRGINSLTNKKLIGDVINLTQFRTTAEITELPANLGQLTDLLKGQINKYYNQDVTTITARDAALQRLILNEFVKNYIYSQHLFRFQQGTDYDTTNINDTYSLKFKALQTRKAENNIWSDANTYMNSTFIGTQKRALEDITDVLSGVLNVENPITQKYLMPMIEEIGEKFISADDKKLIARKLEESLLNFIIHTQTSVRNKGKEYLVDSETALINELKAVKKQLKSSQDTNVINGNVILNQLVASIRGKNSKNTKNVTIAVKAIDVFTKNLYNDSFKELYDNPITHDLADKLVTLSFLQNGIGNSPISFKDAIPADIYSKKINEIVEYLQDEPTLQAFARTGAWYKNNTSDDDIVPTVSETLNVGTAVDRGVNQFIDILKSKGRLPAEVRTQGVLWMEAWKTNPKYVSFRYNVGTEEEPQFATRLYKRVEDEYGTPVIKNVQLDVDARAGNKEMYIPAAKWGDDWRAQEHYDAFQPSVYNNDYQPVQYELDEVELANFLNNGTIPVGGFITSPKDPRNDSDIQNQIDTCL